MHTQLPHAMLMRSLAAKPLTGFNTVHLTPSLLVELSVSAQLPVTLSDMLHIPPALVGFCFEICNCEEKVD